MDESLYFDEEEVSCMCISDKKNRTSDETLALFMHRFNIDIGTAECMPAFEKHCKALLNRDTQKE